MGAIENTSTTYGPAPGEDPGPTDAELEEARQEAIEAYADAKKAVGHFRELSEAAASAVANAAAETEGTAGAEAVEEPETPEPEIGPGGIPRCPPEAMVTSYNNSSDLEKTAPGQTHVPSSGAEKPKDGGDDDAS